MAARHVPDRAFTDRFRDDLDALIAPDAPVGLAVSGGADSMALLLLAAAARPALIQAATVDHRLREGSAGEAQAVARLCAELQVPHRTLEAEWAETPATGIQEKARVERYRLLGQWARQEGLGCVATGHHLDDQAETFVMRAIRGAGVKGLGGMRASAPLPGAADLLLVRPLLGWRRADLQRICSDAGVEPAIDPSNADHAFERVRMREELRQSTWFEPEAAARSATYLAEADAALEWAADQAWSSAVEAEDRQILMRPAGLPDELQRRLVGRAVAMLANEGDGADLRKRELDPLLAALRSGTRATLRGVLCSGGPKWVFIPAPNRTRRGNNPR